MNGAGICSCRGRPGPLADWGAEYGERGDTAESLFFERFPKENAGLAALGARDIGEGPGFSIGNLGEHASLSVGVP